MKTTFKIFLFSITIFLLVIYFNLYFILPGFIVKSHIQDFLYKNYNQKFEVISIEKNYSPDFLHQVTGYKLKLKDNKGIKIGNVFIQKNMKNEWELYQGSDVDLEYAKKKQVRFL